MGRKPCNVNGSATRSMGEAQKLVEWGFEHVTVTYDVQVWWKLYREDYRYCKPRSSVWKGINEMNRNGGWFNFQTIREARDFYEKHGSKDSWRPCKICKPEKPLARARINLNKMRRRIHFHSLKRFCQEFTPLHLYMSALNFLFPERLAVKPKLNKAYPVSGEYVADVDAYLCYMPHSHYTEPEGVCLGCLSLAKNQTLQLLDRAEENYGDIHIVFSGRSGFHVHILDFEVTDWTHYSVDNPQKSYEVARLKYTKLLQKSVPKIFDKHHFILSVDTQRVITFPESLNGETGLVCSYLGKPDDFRDMEIADIIKKARQSKHITAGLNWITADNWKNPRHNLLQAHPEPIMDGQ